jgi:hypothetical protein
MSSVACSSLCGLWDVILKCVSGCAWETDRRVAMEEKRSMGEILIDALEEAIEHSKGRLATRVDRVEIEGPTSELRGKLQDMNRDFEREEN